MKSHIRNKILRMTLSGLLFSVVLVGAMGLYTLSSYIQKHTEHTLSSISEKETIRIAAKLQSIEQYVKTLDYSVLDQFTSIDILTDSTKLVDFTEQNRHFIRSTIKFVPSAVAVYLRYNPRLTPPTSGIFMAKTSLRSSIVKMPPTDFSKYDPSDIEHVGWYYIPTQSGKPTWMAPYKNKNIDIYMISYVIPLSRFGEEIGVVGVDIDFDYLTKEIAHIKLFESGYAYLEHEDGSIAYHPFLKDYTTVKNKDSEISVRSTLPNGMKLVLVVPKSEIYKERNELILNIIIFSIIILLIFCLISLALSKSITKPLHELTRAANQMTSGNMDVSFNIESNDEIGELGKSFANAQKYIQEYLGYIRGVAYKDSLTGVRNKTSFDNFINDLQKKIDQFEISEFGIVIFDTNNLKNINDTYGHDHGNMLLINSCKLICKVFTHSPVFRIGGDEFLVVLQYSDYQNREKLVQLIQEKMIESSATTQSPWETISMASGLGVYDAGNDSSFEDVFKKADRAMYESKRSIKGSELFSI